MFRHKLLLNTAIWRASRAAVRKIKGRWPTDGWLPLRHPTGHVGRFRVTVGPQFIELAGEVIEPRGWKKQPADFRPEWWNREHVVFFLNPGHDHATRRMLAVMRTGEIKTEDVWHMIGEEGADVMTAKISLPPLQPEAHVDETHRGWRLLIRIARNRLGSHLKTRADTFPLGLQIRLGIPGDVIYPAVCWPSADPFWDTNPFSFGDVLEHDAPLQVTCVDFGRPVWKTGEIASEIRFLGHFLRRVPSGICRLTVVHTDGHREVAEQPWRAQGNRLDHCHRVDFPFTSKWAPDVLKTARLEIALLDRTGRSLWQAAYPFGFDAGILVREPFGLLDRSKKGTRRPDSDDPAFVDNYRAWLLRSLPNWRWQTTRQGAPSDFFLRARHRADDVDLMDPRVFQVLASLIHRRFENWQDALCATAMLLHHPCLTTHSASWHRVSGIADTATVLRLGGCFCSDTARLAARLAEALGRLYGVPLKGYVLGLRGHLSGLVETPLGDVLIDPMLGIYYHTLNNQRLATLEEMRAEASIAQRMWSLPQSTSGQPFFHGVQNQNKAPWHDGPLVYPPTRHVR